MRRMYLSEGQAPARSVVLRELNGWDEAVVRPDGSCAATELLADLVVAKPRPSGQRSHAGPGFELAPEQVWELALAERDRLIAELHRWHFGDLIESTVTCSACAQVNDLSFSLAALLDSLTANHGTIAAREDGLVGPDSDGAYRIGESGPRFRLPRASDERRLLELGSHAEAGPVILDACLMDLDADQLSQGQAEAIDRAMEKVSPVIDTQLRSDCPACGHATVVDFDIKNYFLGCLRREAGFVNREVHLLARSYGWSLQEISDLPRSRRRAFVRMIEAERRGAGRGVGA